MGRLFFVVSVSLVSVVLVAHPLAARAGPGSSAPSASVTPDGIVTTLPANLKVPDSLKPVLEEVLRRSPTFRHQIQELRRAPRVRMAISYGNISIWHVLRAESTMYHYESGAILVDTRLYTIRNLVEVIAHELEHVCEGIEGLDIKALARKRNSGVYNSGGRHYETQRAILTGRQVAQEALGVTTDGIVLASHTN